MGIIVIQNIQLFTNRELAQLVERHPYKVDVAGSNPVLPTIFVRRRGR